jgi:phosphatidylglycerophosphatase A
MLASRRSSYDSPTMARPMDRVALTVATALGAGRAPLAPGTAGTAAAIPLAYACAPLGAASYLAVCGLVILVAIWAAGRADRVMGTHDSGRIVIDEVAGYLVTMAWVDRADPVLLVAGFFVFRIADIVKPPPARTLERDLPGGAGVVLDDVAAGLWASVVLAGIALTDLHGHLAAMWR